MITNARSVEPQHPTFAAARPAARPMLMTTLLLMIVATGCGPSAGAAWFFAGMAPKRKIPAEFTLPPGSLMILVDDHLGVVQPPIACHELTNELGVELKEHTDITRITTNEEIARLRQSDPEFDDRTIREVGRMANATTMIWINPVTYHVDSDLEMAHNDGRFTVRVKVFDITAEKKSELRIWPSERDGRTITVTVDAHDIRACKSLNEAHRLLALEMADEIARLFYKHIEEEE